VDDVAWKEEWILKRRMHAMPPVFARLAAVRREPVWLVGGAVILWWLFASQISGHHVDPLVNADALDRWIPQLREAARQWRTGTPPLWNPYQGLGTPLLATLTFGCGYPLAAAYMVLDVGRAWLLTGVAHHLIAAWAMYLFARALDLPPPARLIGAVVYAFCPIFIGKFIDQPQFTTLAWLPVLFACVEELLRAPSLAATARLAAAWALQLLAGHPESIAASALLLGTYVGVRLLGDLRATPRTALAAGAAGLGAAAWALGAAAFQLLPTAELVRHSVRAVGSLTPAQQAMLSASPTLLLVSSVGCMPLALAFVGVWTWSRRSAAWFFGFSMVALALLSLGPMTPIYALAHRLPMATWFRAPARFLNAFPLCVAVLSAGGASALLRAAGTRQRHTVELTAAGSVLMAAFLRLVVPVPRFSMRAWAIALVFDLLPVLVLLAAATGLRARWRPPAMAALAAVVILFCVAPALYLHGFLTPRRVAKQYQPFAGVFAQLREARPARVLPLVSTLDGQAYWAKLGTYFRTPLLSDSDSLSLAAFRTFAHALRGGGPTAGSLESLAPFTGETAPPRGHFDLRLLNLGGVRFVLADARAQTEVGRWFRNALVRQPWASSPAVVYENPDALPRAFFVDADGQRVAGSTCSDQLRELGFDPRRELLLEKPLPTRRGDATGNGAGVSIVEYVPSGVHLRVTAPRAGFVVLTDIFYPGWKASVDGRALPVLRADCFFRAVEVEAGTHDVVLRYAPSSFAIGSLISLVGAAAMAACGVSRFRSAQRARRAQHPPAGPRLRKG
jgi:hypothetical protein